jgi:hypothetical protein
MAVVRARDEMAGTRIVVHEALGRYKFGTSEYHPSLAFLRDTVKNHKWREVLGCWVDEESAEEAVCLIEAWVRRLLLKEGTIDSVV